MKAHAIFDFLHLLVLTLKSYYVWGMPMYVFIIPLIFVVGYIIINSNKKQKIHLFKVTKLYLNSLLKIIFPHFLQMI